MADPMTIVAGLGYAKAGFDTLRAAIGLAKDAKDLLPDDAKSAAITATLEQAERDAKLGEAEVAKALGYDLCKCQFPPTPMLTVGMHAGRPKTGPVFECPRCGFNTAHPFSYERTAPPFEA
ncbi:hypothetical protein FNL56_18400 [Tardiphaga sp. vice304]|uniref:hypothetical protein n=1 Tax=Tardiphaga sp. vice304 TaxID=2592817 RepID=UPI0011653D22|nr:hypothetical protein [Tardiphaga sp. vice304]QDM27879.1 hypothetical protein FNL56_18400 [Tardiphaga sp. vice304]